MDAIKRASKPLYPIKSKKILYYFISLLEEKGKLKMISMFSGDP
jgi:hypothetical protein